MPIEELHGIWELVTIYGETEDGARQYPFTEHPSGRLTYHPEGYMSAFISSPDRPMFSGDARQGTLEEIVAAFHSFEAYAGSYKVDPEQGIVTHYVTMARLPHYENADLVRYFTLDGDLLKIRSAPFQYQGQTVVVYANWRKVM